MTVSIWRQLPNLLLTVAAATLTVSVVLPPSPAAAHPEPSIYPVSWELDFQYDEPRRIVVDVPGDTTPSAYWYMTYRVTNNTDEERLFLPVFEMMTNDGNVTRSDRGINRAVFDAIKRRTGDQFLQTPLELTGATLLIGEDQVRHGVAIWREPNPELGRFVIFVGGLSGETAPVNGADGKPILNDKDRPLLLFKTKQITFRLLGDDVRPGNDLLEKEDESWVMR